LFEKIRYKKRKNDPGKSTSALKTLIGPSWDRPLYYGKYFWLEGKASVKLSIVHNFLFV
jgi:hypothetical protein